jgi:prepilin-type N-terminal cleavage/methylation domain-containing protein
MKGFTLIEMLLTVAVISLLATISVPIFQSFQVRDDLNIAVDTIAQSLRRAQTLSVSGTHDYEWGLYVTTGTIAIFGGEDPVSYASRKPAYDETFGLPEAISPSGLSEVVFSRLYGLPNVTGSFMLSTTINATRTITINEKGGLEY